jgi:proteic killer suppression protein
MIVAFQTEELRRICEDENVAEKKLGWPVASVLRERLADLRAVTSIDVLPVGRPSKTGAVGERLVFPLGSTHTMTWTANHLDPPKVDDGFVDWSRTSRIQLLAIERL